MNVSRSFFAPRPKNDWKSWRSMVITFPFVIGVFFVAPQAVREHTAASRQQTSQGTVTAYELSNHNQCSYTFEANGRLYGGTRSAATTDVRVGDRVLVYYDSQDPTMNALEDFSEMSHNDRGFVEMLLFVIGAFAAVIFYSKATAHRKGAYRRTP
jgi:hypothetical protein